MTPAPVPLERSLEGIIEKLSSLEQSPHVRALLIEARRLRSIIANWRSIPPLPQVREEMLARVLHISAAAGASPGMRTDSGMMRAVAQTQLMSDSAPLSVPGYAEDPPMSERMAGEVTMVQAAIELPQTPLDVRQIGLPEDLSPNLVMLRDPFSRGADAYRALRHRLSSGGDPRIIAVTSANPGEGKSTLAINLAAALREGARGRVLLCEANVRHPKLAQMLGFTPPECFGLQLARHRRAPLEPWIAVEQVAPLHIMAVDPNSTNVPLLDPVAFSIAMDRLRVAGYDYVVVDTPPVLGSADVNMISDSVDGVLFATLARKSSGKPLRQAVAQLGSTTMLGAVLLDG